MKPGLNRTSVGLKPASTLDQRWSAPWPQSNQRGIETALIAFDWDDVARGLNRTSVGLKREGGSFPRAGVEPASIEPAWD